MGGARRRAGPAGGGNPVVAAVGAFAVAAVMAAVALQHRGSSTGLPDLLMEVPLGGEMTINTAHGPMLVSVGSHMQCKQCTSFHQSGNLQSLHSCPCQVPVKGTKDGTYYEGFIRISRDDASKVTNPAPAPPSAAEPEAPAPVREAPPPPAPREERTPEGDNTPKASDGGGQGVKTTDGIVKDVGKYSKEYRFRKHKKEARSPPARRGGGGCQTKPLHLRVTAQGAFIDNVPVFPGDERTEAMLDQLFQFFGGQEAGAVLDGTLTCKEQWDLEHPDYLIPKPGWPSDVATKSPYGSTLEPLKDEKSPFQTDIPTILRQKYGEGGGSRRLRQGLVGAMQSRLFQRDAAQYRDRQARGRDYGRTDFEPSGRGGGDSDRHESMKDMLLKLSQKVNKIAGQQQEMDSTLHRAQKVMSWGPQ